MMKTEIKMNSCDDIIGAYLANFEKLSYGIAVVKNDLGSTLLQANSAYYNMIGYTKEQLLEKYENQVANILIDDIYNRKDCHIKTENIDISFDLRIRTADDSIRWIHGFSHYNESLNVFLLTIADITDKLVATARHLSYDVLLVRNEILGHLNINTTEHITVTDVTTDEVIYLNPSASQFFGFHNESDWLGKSYRDIAFGGKENTPSSYYEPVAEDEFTEGEYYNEFYKLHLNIKSKIINIAKLNRKMRLNIITNQQQQLMIQEKLFIMMF